MPRPLSPALLGAGLLLALPAAGAAPDAPPPTAPPDARFGGGPVRLDASPLSLPPGFGVSISRAAAAADALLPAPDAVASPPSGVRVPPPPGPGARPAPGALHADLPGGRGGTPPPVSLPPSARFATGAVGLGELALNVPLGFGVGGATSSPAGDGAPAGAPLPGFGVTDLPGAASSPLPGMSMAEEGSGRLRFTLGADTLFDFDKAVLRAEADPVLRKLVEEVRARGPGASYRVEGHTDAIGSGAYNDGLSRRRAAAVQMWLIRQGDVPARDVSMGWFGKRRPVAPNTRPDGTDDSEGRQRNRRVEVVVTPRP